MGRLSLYDTLSKRADFKEIVKRVNLSSDPIKFVQNNFQCAYMTASKFVQQVGLSNVKLNKDKQEIAKDLDSNRRIAYLMLECFEQDLKRESGKINILMAFGEKVDNCKYEILVELFKMLNEKEPKKTKCILLAKTVKCCVQHKFYKEIFKVEAPESINKTRESLLALV